jgi:low temperature requirement protein LtrA
LFIIIALGEAILVTGATFAPLTPKAPVIPAFAVSFVATAAMWWIDFDTGAKRRGEAIEHDPEAGRPARNAYSYLHMPIVAGIVVTDEMMLAHPVEQHAELDFIFVACGGPLLCLVGNQIFKSMTAERPMPPLAHFIGIALLFAIGVAGWCLHLDPLSIGTLAAAVRLVTAVWEG